VVALGVPIFDTLFAMVRRFLERRPLFSPDRGHIHHRLLDLGLTHRRVVLILYGCSIVFTVAAIGIYLGRSWQVGLALLSASVVVIGLARSVGYFSYLALRKRQRARVRSRDTELLRSALPKVPAIFAAVRREQDLFSALATLAAQTQLVAVEIHAGETCAFSWTDGSADRRRVVCSMTYPLGHDALARAELRVTTVNDFEDAEMQPQSDILLQVVADVVATNLTRLGSELAPRPSERREAQIHVEPEAEKATALAP
jgi:UDP-GlcNAc:undecaprenyl-phosphate GlcNAc-1-phosphate transferase